MEETLHAEVELDISSIPKHQRGLISTLSCIIKRMVIKNQEAKHALENYIRTFDITKFSGKNVPTACLCLKAIAGALGNNYLPTNTDRKVLEGFAKLLTTSFNKFCASQITLHQGSFYMNLMRGTPLQSQLNNLLNNLEVTYLDLVREKLWLGITATPQQSSFLAGNIDDENKLKVAQARAAKINLPWDKWVKLYTKCHHCNIKGHICPQCPSYIKKVKLGEIKCSNGSNCPSPCSPPPARPSNCAPPLRSNIFLKDPKAKAFLSAFQALFTDDEENEDKNGAKDQDAKEDDKPNEDANENIHNFLLMVGSLKE
jgi:hypothetical protein